MNETNNNQNSEYHWAKHAVFYQIFVRSYYDGNGDGIGDLIGITQKIPYLKELGISAIWLMPIMTSSTYHGYDVMDYYQIEPDYGTLSDFATLVEICHNNGIRVIIDLVLNHTSVFHPWFKEAILDASSTYRNFYTIASSIPDLATHWHSDWEYGTNLYYYGEYDRIMPDLNYENELVRQEIKKIAKFWIDQGIDGFRLDGAKTIHSDSSITHDWWKEFTSYVLSLNNNLFLVAENWYDSMYTIANFYKDLPSSFNFPMAAQLEQLAAGAIVDVITLFQDGHALYQQAATSSDSVISEWMDSIMIGNHDMDRIYSRLNSDKKVKLASSLLLTMPAIPFLYYGDELGMKGQSPDGNRREPMDWYTNGQGEGMVTMDDSYYFATCSYTIPNDGISYEDQKNNPNSLLHHYQKLIRLRQSNPLFALGTYKTLAITSDGLYVYRIFSNESKEQILVLHNIREQNIDFTFQVDCHKLLTKDNFSAGTYHRIAGYDSEFYTFIHTTFPIEGEHFIYKEQPIYTVTLVIQVPKNTPSDEPIYIVGDFNHWNPSGSQYRLTKVDHTTFSITLKRDYYSTIYYKFTRGGWDTREQNRNGEDLVGPTQTENRHYQFIENDTIIDCTIEHWIDL